MKPTGLYYEAYSYPYEFHVFRLGRTRWRFNAQNLDTGKISHYLFTGDDEDAILEFRQVKSKRNLTGFTVWE